MEKLRSTLKQLVRDWSEEVYNSLREIPYSRLVLTAHTGKSGAGRLLRAHQGGVIAAFLRHPAGGKAGAVIPAGPRSLTTVVLQRELPRSGSRGRTRKTGLGRGKSRYGYTSIIVGRA